MAFTVPTRLRYALGAGKGDVCLKQHLRLTGHRQGTRSSLRPSRIVRRSMRLYLHKRQQPSVAGLLSFLDVSSLNSAAPRGAALFLPTPGGAWRAPCPTVHRTRQLYEFIHSRASGKAAYCSLLRCRNRITPLLWKGRLQAPNTCTPNRAAAASSSTTSPSRHWRRFSSLVASCAGIPRASPIAAGVVMPRSSNSLPIAIRRRMHFTRSACRARRSSAESLGFEGSDGGGGWSGGRLMPCMVAAVVPVVTPRARGRALIYRRGWPG